MLIKETKSNKTVIGGMSSEKRKMSAIRKRAMLTLLTVFTFFSFNSLYSRPLNQELSKPKKILLIQGANMSYLGKRDPKHYGSTTAAQLDEMLKSHAKTKGFELDIFYTNSEGSAIDKIYAEMDKGVDGIVMNPGGFTYSGISLRDCLISVSVPYVEVHMLSEKDWSGESVTMAAADGKISGFGAYSYILGLDAILNILNEKSEK